jgi:hypothetical protein
MKRRRFANSPWPVRTDRFSFVLFALRAPQLHRNTPICSLEFSKCSAKLLPPSAGDTGKFSLREISLASLSFTPLPHWHNQE